MANKYINIAHLYKRMPVLTDTNGDHLIAVSDLRTAIAMAAAKTGEVVEVVRCKDCVYYKPYAKPVEDFDGRCTARRGETDEDEFCNRGTRREQ
jgi:hypothetical protein